MQSLWRIARIWPIHNRLKETRNSLLYARSPSEFMKTNIVGLPVSSSTIVLPVPRDCHGTRDLPGFCFTGNPLPSPIFRLVEKTGAEARDVLSNPSLEDQTWENPPDSSLVAPTSRFIWGDPVRRTGLLLQPSVCWAIFVPARARWFLNHHRRTGHTAKT